MSKPDELHCVSRVAVVSREGKRSYVEEFVASQDQPKAQTIYMADGAYCVIDVDGSFVVVRTGERLRRVV